MAAVERSGAPRARSPVGLSPRRLRQISFSERSMLASPLRPPSRSGRASSCAFRRGVRRDAQLFLQSSATAEIDERTSEGVNRVNRWDTDNRLRDSGRLDGVYARVASSLGVDLDVKGMTEFTLMHEFTREHNFFGWHVDSSPGDGKPPRTLNVNVMLSTVGVDYTGGQLQVGDTNVSAQKGDLYLYPAAFPHAVDLRRACAARSSSRSSTRRPTPQAAPLLRAAAGCPPHRRPARRRVEDAPAARRVPRGERRRRGGGRARLPQPR